MIRFTLTEKEEEEYKKFMEEHIHKDIYTGAIGGGQSITFQPNAIGRAVICKCGLCGEEKNITDYDAW